MLVEEETNHVLIIHGRAAVCKPGCSVSRRKISTEQDCARQDSRYLQESTEKQLNRDKLSHIQKKFIYYAGKVRVNGRTATRTMRYVFQGGVD
jgi:hypothetical protein